MDIGDRIKKRRKELDLSAEQVAEKLGVSPATIYRYESNDIMNMRIDKLEPIAKVLRTTPAYLMGWDETEEKKTNTDNQQQKLLSNYNKLDNTDQTKLVDYSDELVNSDKYKETVTISIAARNGATEMKLTQKQYEKFLKVIKEETEDNKDKKLPDGLV